MKVLEYIGKTATARIIRKEDFQANGIDDQDEIKFDVVDIPTRGQAEVSDAAASMLLELESGNFREVPEDKLALAYRPKSSEGASGADREDTSPE